jgi:hypothetical protein
LTELLAMQRTVPRIFAPDVLRTEMLRWLVLNRVRLRGMLSAKFREMSKRSPDERSDIGVRSGITRISLC